MLLRRPSLWMSFGLLSVVLLLFSLTLYAAENKSETKSNDQTNSTEQAKIDKEIGKERKEIINEAVDAIANIRKALAALEKDKQREALNALEKAVGELEIVIARDPDLALAAIDTQIIIYDLFLTLENIKQAREQAEDYLENNQIQKARAILKSLASEIIVSTTSIPLGTYPKVIKDVVPLIDAGKTKEARTALQDALNSLVVTNDIIALPIIRAEESLDKAEALAEKNNRTEEETIFLLRFLNQARYQLRISEALGYSDKDDYNLLHEQLNKIEEKTKGKKSGSGYFNEIRGFLSELVRPLTDKN